MCDGGERQTERVRDGGERQRESERCRRENRVFKQLTLLKPWVQAVRIPVNHDLGMFIPLLREALYAADVLLCVSGDPNVSGSQVRGSTNSLPSSPLFRSGGSRFRFFGGPLGRREIPMAWSNQAAPAALLSRSQEDSGTQLKLKGDGAQLRHKRHNIVNNLLQRLHSLNAFNTL